MGEKLLVLISLRRKSRFLIALVEVRNASVILAYAQFLHTGRDAVLA